MKRTVTIVAVACGLMLTLAGCSSLNHQIVTSSDICETCHDEKETYELDEAPASAEECGTTVTVTTSSDATRLYICEPIFVSEDGKQFVPVKDTTASFEDGTATVELEEGVWVLAIDEGDEASTVLVSVSADVTDVVEFTL